MAQTRMGSVYADISGKIGGSVATRNRSGQCIRTHVKPTNPKTEAQVQTRAIFTDLSKQWRTLTDAQRSQWNNAVNDFMRSNKLGVKTRLSGFQLFQKFNNNILLIGGTIILVPPAPTSVSIFDTMSLVADNSSNSLTLTFSPAIPATESIKVYATPPLSPGKSYIQSEYRLIAVYDNTGVSPLALSADYIASFGGIGAVGKKIALKVEHVNEASGIVSQAQEVSTLTVA